MFKKNKDMQIYLNKQIKAFESVKENNKVTDEFINSVNDLIGNF